ncbi:SDR family NAD(P)-dependent oxidoreductase [Lutimonas halocynthiae]|uniref:SDR family NAD(P)-dependent oxidoreductase n=1 Tax=Lutimonas halocynthiae TaxID=1446477 RepID=UPI0025B33C11|nr:SDR family NAD(P)-dependent oxidoreductase [Lutimonas halocynthiae]MDN3643299.1 SDR family NAD(P)-dependent oxidoreductase [Lutimonas halocynthiae]
MNTRVDQQLILITGGSSGIGKAAAAALHRNGAKIILQARNLAKLKAAAEEIDPNLERISYYSADLSNEDEVISVADELIKKEGLPDVIINSAGAGEWLSFNEADLGHYRETINSPYLATASTCKVFFDRMQQRGSGHFIIINSAACYFSFPGTTGYAPARWAMLGFAKALQADLYDTNFKVSMIALGKVDSPYFDNNPLSEDRIPKIADWLIPTMTLNTAAKVIMKTVETKKNTVIKPFMMSMMVFLNRFMPGIFRWLMRITSNVKST